MNANNARQHSARQLAKLEASIRSFGFLAPVLTDAEGVLIAGHGRVEAARRLGLAAIPAITVSHLSEAQCRAYMLADNRIADEASYDETALAREFEYLIAQASEIEITDTGFEIAEVDRILESHYAPVSTDDDDGLIDPARVAAVCRPGDLWLMGGHCLLCGDALDPLSYRILLGEDRADMVFTDPPYNLPIPGMVSGLGKVRHDNFVMASGEMSEAQFAAFLRLALTHLAGASRAGSLHYVCMDWRQIAVLIEVGREIYDEYKALCVWDKGRGAMGAPYRSAHELIAVFKNGTVPHRDNVKLGKHGRNRTNIWHYPGMAGFAKGRSKLLAIHPTVKNLAMVADAILDCTKPGDLVLDGFAGSGTTALAAQRTGRRSALIELDTTYCDRLLRRFCDATGIEPVNAWTGEVVHCLPAKERGMGK